MADLNRPESPTQLSARSSFNTVRSFEDELTMAVDHYLDDLNHPKFPTRLSGRSSFNTVRSFEDELTMAVDRRLDDPFSFEDNLTMAFELSLFLTPQNKEKSQEPTSLTTTDEHSQEADVSTTIPATPTQGSESSTAQTSPLYSASTLSLTTKSAPSEDDNEHSTASAPAWMSHPIHLCLKKLGTIRVTTVSNIHPKLALVLPEVLGFGIRRTPRPGRKGSTQLENLGDYMEDIKFCLIRHGIPAHLIRSQCDGDLVARPRGPGFDPITAAAVRHSEFSGRGPSRRRGNAEGSL